ncbi:hypothetical protein KP509_20G009600 [Ceratopteris richardii]|nr:hypothetical protein KP509_20G009600 [Ceratopteris richardii]
MSRQDARTSTSMYVPRGSFSTARRGENDATLSQENEVFLYRERADRGQEPVPFTSQGRRIADSIEPHLNGRNNGVGRQRRNPGSRDGRFDGLNRYAGNGEVGSSDNDGVRDTVNYQVVSNIIHFDNGQTAAPSDITVHQQANQGQASDVNFSRSVGSHPSRAGPGGQRSSNTGNRRQHWRPAASRTANSGRMDQSSAHDVIPIQSEEASREALNGALRSLSIHRMEQQSFNKGSFSRQQDIVHKQSKGYARNARKGQKFTTTHDLQKEKVDIPQLVQELEDKLSKGQVECMICYDMVRREAAIWSCGSCYAIFHITCTRKWARAPISADYSIASTNEVSVGSWRCPGCQSPQFLSVEEIKYNCFCGQVLEPQVDYYLTPHSCGGPCKKSLSSAKCPHCKHVCTMQCHPGPCPPCNAMAPPQLCPCGKTSFTQRCSELKSAKSCGQICGHQLQCGRHFCQKICHEGPCGSCDTLMVVRCFCGRKEEAILCGTMSLQGELDSENGVFSCEYLCLNKLRCGKHSCNRICHPGKCEECELAPEKVKTCPCGKTPIQGLLGAGKQRKNCTDPVPHCGQVCEKLLPCGMHKCQSLCHNGHCPPCEVLVDQKCRCSSSSQTVPCYKAMDLRKEATVEESAVEFLCNRTCGKKKSCGRHRCSNKCCALANSNVAPPPGQDPHLCLLPCGKKLRCGQHVCEELCHSGYCRPCLGSTFTDLTCACGRTSIPPPVPCGTPPPSCTYPCSQPQPCGHAATHQCHFGECPPCVALTSKECVGGHVTLTNVPCGSKDIKCNKPCGRPRQCRLHACARLCHLPPCEEVTEVGPNKVSSCKQQCGAPRRDCEHVCVALCHPGSSCPEERCKFPVTITCSCGRLKHQVLCDAGEASRGHDVLELAYISSLPLQPVDSKVKIPLGQRKLACDEECAKLEKKRILADAFGMTGVPDDPALCSESVQATSDALREILIRDPQWVLAIEDRFKYLVLGTKSSAGPIRVHVFGFLPKERRDIIRQLADRWNLSVNAAGREPKRFLTVHVNSKSHAPHSRMLFGKAALPVLGHAQASAFNSSLDMDPRLVVGLFDLPREADISTLVLRFGGECELVWLNDKNALAVFFDIMRAATAIRRVDHASAYTGAVKTLVTTTAAPSGKCWGDGVTTSKTFSRRKVVEESNWSEDAWGEKWARSQGETAWDIRGPPISTSTNPWGALEHDSITSSDTAQGMRKVAAPIVSGHTQELSINIAADSWEDLDD